MRPRIVERPGAAHVDDAGRAAFEHLGQRALVDRQAGEELGREQVEVDLAVGVLQVGAAGRGDGDRRVVELDAGEAGAEAADRDFEALAGRLAGDDHAGDAVERLGDIGVGELADLFGEDRIGEADRIALGVDRAGEAAAIAGDDDLIVAGGGAQLGSRRRRRSVRIGRLRRSGRGRRRGRPSGLAILRRGGIGPGESERGGRAQQQAGTGDGFVACYGHGGPQSVSSPGGALAPAPYASLAAGRRWAQTECYRYHWIAESRLPVNALTK